jgi:hypothetical protein
LLVSLGAAHAVVKQRTKLFSWQQFTSDDPSTSFYLSLSLLASAMTLIFCVLVKTASRAPAMLCVVTAALLLYPPMVFSTLAIQEESVLGSRNVAAYLAFGISLATVKSVRTRHAPPHPRTRLDTSHAPTRPTRPRAARVPRAPRAPRAPRVPASHASHVSHAPHSPLRTLWAGLLMS